MYVPLLGPQVPQRGNAGLRAAGRGLLRAGGWRFEGAFPDLKQMIVIVAPHTSNWDFWVGVWAMFALGLRVSWFGKHTLFRAPLGGLMRWLGGIPVRRDRDQGLVEQAVGAFRREARLVLALAPEGTRRRVARWKTGFYHIALGAGVPILLVGFDYGRRTIVIGPTVSASGDLDADLAEIRAFHAGVQAKHPQQA